MVINRMMAVHWADEGRGRILRSDPDGIRMLKILLNAEGIVAGNY